MTHKVFDDAAFYNSFLHTLETHFRSFDSPVNLTEVDELDIISSFTRRCLSLTSSQPAFTKALSVIRNLRASALQSLLCLQKVKHSDGEPSTAGNHDSTGQFTTPEEPAFMVRDADRAHAIREAVSKNMRVVNRIDSPEDKHQVVAGHLGLMETIPLRMVAEIGEEEVTSIEANEDGNGQPNNNDDEPMPPPGTRQGWFSRRALGVARQLYRLSTSKTAGFGTDGVTKNWVPTSAALIKAAREFNGVLTQEDLDSGLPLTVEHHSFGPKTKRSRALASFIVGLYQIMLAKEWFHHSYLYEPTSAMRSSYIGSITSNDWNAVLIPWRWWVGLKQLEKGERAKEQQKNNSTRNWNNQASTRVIYLTDNNLHGVDDEEARETTSLGAVTQYAMDTFKDARLRSLVPSNEEEDSPDDVKDNKKRPAALSKIKAQFDPKRSVSITTPSFLSSPSLLV